MMSIFTSIILAGSYSTAVPIVYEHVSPDVPLATSFRVSSSRDAGFREFCVAFSDTLIRSPGMLAYCLVWGSPLSRLDPVRVDGGWEVSFQEPLAHAWTATLVVTEPSSFEGPEERRGYRVPLFRFIGLGQDELDSFAAAKESALAYDVVKYQGAYLDRAGRRGDLRELEAVFRVLDEVGTQTRVLFLDGSDALIPVIPPPD